MRKANPSWMWKLGRCQQYGWNLWCGADAPNNFRMLKKTVQQGRSEVRDAKNNERLRTGASR